MTLGRLVGVALGCRKSSWVLVGTGASLPLVALAADQLPGVAPGAGVTWPQVALYAASGLLVPTLAKVVGTFDRLVSLLEGIRTDVREGRATLPAIQLVLRHEGGLHVAETTTDEEGP